jgi:hypothetical protein
MPPKPSPVSPSAQIDRQLAAEALAKHKRGEKPTGQERAALRRVERQREEELRWQYYETVPQKHFRELTGRQLKQLQDFAARWGAPCDRATVNLRTFLRWAFDFFAAHTRKLSAVCDDSMLGDSDSPALERYRKVRADQEELKLEEMRRRYVNRETFLELYQRGQARVRAGMEDLRRAFGQDAARIVEEAWRDAAEIVAGGDDPVDHDDGSERSEHD